MDLQNKGSIESFPGADNSRLNLVSIRGSQAIVRNDGTSPITDMQVFVNGELLNYTLSPPIMPGELRIIEYPPRKAYEPLEVMICYNDKECKTSTSPPSNNPPEGGFVLNPGPLNPLGLPGVYDTCLDEIVNFENNEDFNSSTDLGCGCDSLSFKTNALTNPGFENDLTDWINSTDEDIISESFAKEGVKSFNMTLPSKLITGNPEDVYLFRGVFGVIDYLSFDGYYSSESQGNYSYAAAVRYGTLNEDDELLLGPQIIFIIHASTGLMNMCGFVLEENVTYIECSELSNIPNQWITHEITNIQSYFLSNFTGINLDNYNVTAIMIQSAIHPAEIESSIIAFADNVFINASGQGHYCDSDFDGVADGSCNNNICETGYCGDSICNPGENSTSCPEDCQEPENPEEPEEPEMPEPYLFANNASIIEFNGALRGYCNATNTNETQIMKYYYNWTKNGVLEFQGIKAKQESISAGYVHTCVLKNDGNVGCWGSSESGQSANYTKGDAIAISSGGHYTCVLKSDGNAECWEVGVQNYTKGDAIAISSGYTHTCVLKSNGNVECWGYEDSRTANYTNGDAISIVTGDDHNCVLKSDGNAECWGDNYQDRATNYTKGDAIAISSGSSHNCVL
jgi:hypothetical protein